MRGRLRWTNVLGTLILLAIVAGLVEVVLVTRKDPVGPDLYPPIAAAGVSPANGQVWVSGGLTGRAALHPTPGAAVSWKARNLVSGFTPSGSVSATPIELPVPSGEWLARSAVVRGTRGLVVLGTLCAIPQSADTSCSAADGKVVAWVLNKTTAKPLALSGAIALTHPTQAPTIVAVDGNVVTLVETVEQAGALPHFQNTVVRLDLSTGKSRAIGVPGVVNGPASVCLAGNDLVVAVPAIDGTGVVTGFRLLVRGVNESAWDSLTDVTVSAHPYGGIAVACQPDRVVVGVGTIPTQLTVLALPTGHVIRGTGAFSLSGGVPSLRPGPNGRSLLAVPIHVDGRAEQGWYLETDGALKRIRSSTVPAGHAVDPAVIAGQVYDLSSFDPNGRATGRPGHATLIH